MSISNAYELLILDAIFNNVSLSLAQPYLSLHTADPGETGASEVSGGAGPYARQAVNWDPASAGAVVSDGAIDFPGMPAVTVTHVGIWSAASGGTFVWGGALSSSKVVNAGDTFHFNDTAITVMLD